MKSDILARNLIKLSEVKVEAIVPTYHPAGEHGCEDKGVVYEKRRRRMEKAGR